MRKTRKSTHLCDEPIITGFNYEDFYSAPGVNLFYVLRIAGIFTKALKHLGLVCMWTIITFNPQEMNEAGKTGKAIFAGGCFWGMEYLMQKLDGVISTTVGYTGGHVENPAYEDVSGQDSGHVEALEVTYDPEKISYEELTKYFFEIHDPTQVNRQGPDVGEQYRSEIFYLNENQKNIAEKLIQTLKNNGYEVATKLTKASAFFPAEGYHQDYYEKAGGVPYCHSYQKRF